MRTKNTQKRSRKLLVLALLLFLTTLLAPLLHPAPTYALDNDKLSQAEQQQRTQVYAIVRCFELSHGLATDVAGTRLNQQAIWATEEQGDGNENSIPIGYEIDGDNGVRECQNLDYDALSFVGMSWDSFRERAYGNTPEANGHYHLKPGAAQYLHQTILDRLKDKQENRGQKEVVGQKEKDRRVLVGLSKCIQTIPKGKAATQAKVSKPGYEKYEFRSGMDGGSTVPMGQDLTFYDSDNDGTYTCDTLINLGKNIVDQLGDKTLEEVTGNVAEGGGDDSELGCEATANPLSWIICPVTWMLTEAIGVTDDLITQQMILPANDIFCLNTSGNNDTCDAYYAAWVSFRNIALGLIAIAGLIVVIAQAVGMEILDAYTIRKMLPRILVAAIAITLSWPLMNFAVTLSNNLGFGVRDLITAPFDGLDNVVNLNFSSSGAVNLIGGFSAVLIGGTLAIVFGGLGLLLSYLATAGLAVLVAIMVLVLREIAVIMLIILSPLAIVAYVMPNTQRIFRLWWESFSRALLMFPLIAGFIAAGRVFAAISLSGNNGTPGSLFNQVIAFVAYFGPYFLIPLTFRLSGGIMNGLGNAVNQRAQPGFERLKKGRAEGYARKWQDWKDEKRLHEDVGHQAYRGFAKRFNRLGGGVGRAKDAGYNPYHMKDRMAAARSTHHFAMGGKLLQEDPDLRYALSNDDIAESLIPGVESYKGSGHFGGGDDKARRQFLMDRTYTQESGLEEMVAAGRAASRKLPAGSVGETAWVANWSTGTGFSEKEWKEEQPDGTVVTRKTGGSGEALMALADMTKGSHGGDQLRANLIAQAREGATRQRRSDFHGQSFTEQMLLAREVAGPGYGQPGLTRGEAEDAITEKVRKGAAFGKSRGEHITGRPQAIKAMVPQFISNFDQILENSEKDGTRKQLMEELAMVAAGQSSAGQASPENAKEHGKYLAHEIDLKHLPPRIDDEVKDVIYKTAQAKGKKLGGPVDKVTVGDLLEVNRQDPEVANLIYQYGKQYEADAEMAYRAAAQAGGEAEATRIAQEAEEQRQRQQGQ